MPPRRIWASCPTTPRAASPLAPNLNLITDGDVTGTTNFSGDVSVITAPFFKTNTLDAQANNTASTAITSF